MDREIVQADGTTIRHWTDDQGREWARHSESNARRAVDDFLRELFELVEEGLAVARQNAGGAFELRLTQKGMAAAESLLATPEGAVFHAEMQRLGAFEDREED